MKGLIIVGYQGIGKSACGGYDGCIDLESGNFFVGDERHDDWYIPYCNIAMNIANQGYTVFTSSHKVIYEHFKTMPKLPNVYDVVVFCPCLEWKNQWIERLQKRYEETGLHKDYKALMNAKERYTENITELMTCGLPCYQPDNIYYDLNARIKLIRFKYRFP